MDKILKNILMMIFLSSFHFGISGTKDSLISVIKNSTHTDTNLVKTHRTLAYYYLVEEDDVQNSLKHCLAGIESAKKSESSFWMGKMHSLTAYIYQFYTSDFEAAIKHHVTAIKHFNPTRDVIEIYTVNLNLGVLYYNYGQLQDAEKYLKEALIMADKINNESEKATVLLNLGSVYESMGKYIEAIAAFEIALEIYKNHGSEIDVAAVEHNLTNITIKRTDMQIGENTRRAAIKKYETQREIFRKYEDEASYVAATLSIGIQYSELNQLSDGLVYLKEAEKLATKLSDYNSLLIIVESIAKNYEKQKDFSNEALYLKKAMNINNLLFNQNKLKAIAETQIKYETEKKESENEILLQQSKIKDLELEKKDIQLVQSKTIFYSMMGGLSLILLFTAFLYNRFKLISQQKKTIEKQKNLVDEKQKEISSSINYAKRIQEAILPSQDMLLNNLDEGFVLFKPKDIVSGDFYWLESYAPPTVRATDSEGNIILFAAADCTGHGVPGAMVSVVCANALSKALLEEGITDPEKILDRSRELVVERFSKNDEDVKDGMDISLCALQGNTLSWSGANNPLWIIANENRTDLSGFKNLTGLGGKALYEIKPNKQPIGKVDNPKPFTAHTIELQEGDTIYIFTDGYQDQFGGPRGKKFKASQLKELILSIQYRTMNEQKQILDDVFEEWKGDLEQIDDVCIIGVRV